MLGTIQQDKYQEHVLYSNGYSRALVVLVLTLRASWVLPLCIVKGIIPGQASKQAGREASGVVGQCGSGGRCCGTGLIRLL